MEAWTFSLSLTSTVTKVFPLIATAHGLSRWFREDVVFRDDKDIDPRALPHEGCEYEWRLQDIVDIGVICAFETNKFIAFSWGSSNHTLRIDLRQQAENYLLCQVSALQNPNSQLNVWKDTRLLLQLGFAFGNLKSVVEYGKDLREKRPDAESVGDLLNL